MCHQVEMGVKINLYRNACVGFKERLLSQVPHKGFKIKWKLDLFVLGHISGNSVMQKKVVHLEFGFTKTWPFSSGFCYSKTVWFQPLPNTT